jgi:hypothetical protein
MPRIDAAYVAHQRKRWMRPNAHLFIRPDWRRFVRPGGQKDHPFALYERKHRPDQLRDEIGRWADEGGEGGQETSPKEGEDDRIPANAKPVQYTAQPSSLQPNEAVDVAAILEKAKQLAASGYSNKYLRCLDLCAPILERFQPKGSDINEWTYRRCIAACMGNSR